MDLCSMAAAVQSVSGGGHWGADVHQRLRSARFGLLTLRRGVWGGVAFVSERWVQMALTPTPAQTDYGFMNWFLNTGRSAAERARVAYMPSGTAPNMIYVDPSTIIVIVARGSKRFPRWSGEPACLGGDRLDL